MNYQVMPDLSPQDYEALKNDIAHRGVLIPVEYDEHGNVLDGYHRLRACKELTDHCISSLSFSDERGATSSGFEVKKLSFGCNAL